MSGTFHGKAEYAQKVYQPLAAHLSTWPRPSVLRVLADGEWGTVEFLGKGGIGNNGTDYAMRYCWILRVVGGKVVEVTGYFDQTKVIELFA